MSTISWYSTKKICAILAYLSDYIIDYIIWLSQANDSITHSCQLWHVTKRQQTVTFLSTKPRQSHVIFSNTDVTLSCDRLFTRHIETWHLTRKVLGRGRWFTGLSRLFSRASTPTKHFVENLNQSENCCSVHVVGELSICLDMPAAYGIDGTTCSA